MGPMALPPLPPRVCARCGVTHMFRHSSTNSAVSNRFLPRLRDHRSPFLVNTVASQPDHSNSAPATEQNVAVHLCHQQALAAHEYNICNCWARNHCSGGIYGRPSFAYILLDCGAS